MATKARGAVPAAVRPGRPSDTGGASFHMLRPVRPGAALTPALEADLGYLQFIAGEDDEIFARAVLGFSLRRSSRRTAPFVRPPTISVMNRRKRAARLWVNAVLAGDVSAPTLRALTQVWLPQLAGTGPDAWRAVSAGRSFVETLRGVISASVMAETMPCLLRHARALHALEAILAIHLGAILSVPRPAKA